MIPHVSVKVKPTIKLCWIFTDESSGRLVVVSGAVVVEARFGVEVATGVAEGIRDRARGSCDLAEAVVSVAERKRAGRVRERGDRAETVLLVVIGCAASRFLISLL